MQISDLKELAISILRMYDYEDAYIYINGEKVNIASVDTFMDNGYLSILFSTGDETDER